MDEFRPRGTVSKFPTVGFPRRHCAGHRNWYLDTIIHIAHIHRKFSMDQNIKTRRPQHRSYSFNTLLVTNRYSCLRTSRHTYTFSNMVALKTLYQQILRHTRTVASKPPAKPVPAPRADLSRGAASGFLRFIAAEIIGSIAVQCAIEFPPPGTPEPALVKAGQKNIVEKAEERIKNIQRRFIPELARAGRRNIEDNAEKRLASFERLSRALLNPRRRR